MRTDDPVESIEGWFMDGGYGPDRGFWQMGAEIVEALRNEGWAIVSVPEGVDTTQIQWSWRYKPLDPDEMS